MFLSSKVLLIDRVDLVTLRHHGLMVLLSESALSHNCVKYADVSLETFYTINHRVTFPIACKAISINLVSLGVG